MGSSPSKNQIDNEVPPNNINKDVKHEKEVRSGQDVQQINTVDEGPEVQWSGKQKIVILQALKRFMSEILPHEDWAALQKAELIQVARKMARKDMEPTQIVIEKGSTSNDMYFIIEGEVNILCGTDLSIKMDRLVTEDYFGDVSILFDIPVAATVTVNTKTVLAVLSRYLVKSLIDEKNKPKVQEWFSLHKYIPTTIDGLDPKQWHTDVMLEAIRQVPLLEGWSTESLKCLVNIHGPSPIVFCPTGAMIMYPGDPVDNLIVIIKGSIAAYSSTKTSLGTIYVKDTPFIFGEEGIFSGKASQLSLICRSPCLVVMLNMEFLTDVSAKFVEAGMYWLNNFGRWKRNSYLRNQSVYNVHGSQLQIEILAMILGDTRPFIGCPSQMLYQLAQSCIGIVFKPGEVILSSLRKGDLKMYVILNGTMNIMKRGSVVPVTCNTSQVFYSGHWDWKDTNLVSETETLLAEINYGYYRTVLAKFPAVEISWQY